MSNTIDVEATVQGKAPEQQQQQPQGPGNMGLQISQAGAVGRAMGMEELKANLEFIRDVMKNVMKEGQDYGKIPGTGDKPTLLQPGAQKLLMTFQLTEYVKKEVLREYPNMHREYEFVVTVKAQNGKEWDGVGTCTTFEKKYRYRQGGRKCPQCGRPTILQSKKGRPEFFCWEKKGGCGAKFDLNDERITRQQEGNQIENPDIADQWNAVRKVGFKRALVHAAINATNTSELWTQDLEDKAGEDGFDPPANAPGPRQGSQTPRPAARARPTPSAAPAHTAKTVPLADANSRGKMLRKFDDLNLLTEYFRKIGWLLPQGETVEDLPLRYVPITKRQGDTLMNCFLNFKDGGDAVVPYPPNPESSAAKAPAAAKPAVSTPATSNEAPKSDKRRDPEWWRDIICPVPRKGMNRDDYLKHPDTVGSMYDDRHNEETARRLFGFINKYEVQKTWTGNDGQERANSPAQIATDTLFREALDACKEYADKHHSDTESPARIAGQEDAQSELAREGYAPAEPEDDDVPF